jgi:hypothetical protein
MSDLGKVFIKGRADWTQLPSEVDFDPVRGLVMTQKFVGGGLRSLEGLFQGFYTAGIACRWKPGVKSELSAHLSGGQGSVPDDLQTNWQLMGNEIQKSIFFSPMAIEVEVEFPGTLDKVRRDFDRLSQGQKAGTPAPAAGAMDTYNELLGLLRLGQSTFATAQYVLRRTVTVSKTFRNGASQLLPLEGEVGNVIPHVTILTDFGLPYALAQLAAGIPIAGAHAGFNVGWRQLPSTATTGAQNRVEVSTEWWLDEWRATLYPAA